MTYEEFIHLFELCCDIAPECGVVKVFVPSKEYYKNFKDEDFIRELEEVFFNEKTVEKAIKMFFEVA